MNIRSEMKKDTPQRLPHRAENEQTLMVVLFRLSYLHSHRGQNSCSWPRINSATFGNTMLSQSLEKVSLVLKTETTECHHSFVTVQDVLLSMK